MDIDFVAKWVGLVALLLSIGNLLWAWLSRPARDLSARLDKHREETDKQIDEVAKQADEQIDGVARRIDETFEGLKGHDRRIQRVEDDLRHLPTKKDLQEVELKVTAIKTELDIVAKVVSRIDDFLRGTKP